MSSSSPESNTSDITTALAAAPPPPAAFEGTSPALQKESQAYKPVDTEKALQQYRESLRLHMARMAQGFLAHDLDASTQKAGGPAHLDPSATDVQDALPKDVPAEGDPVSGAAAPRP